MTRFFCIFALMILALPAFGHMTDVSGDDGWHHLDGADRKAYHKDLHWHISNDLQLETSWSRCVNQPGVYDESTGEYDFRKCDKEDPPANTEPTNPTPADAQEYDEYLESLEDDPVYVDGRDYQEYLDSIAPETRAVPVSVRYSFDDFALAKAGELNEYYIGFGVRRGGGYTNRPEVTVSVSPKSHGGERMRLRVRHGYAPPGSSTITTRPVGGIISLALSREDGQKPSGEFTITATINEGSQTWTKSQSFVWDQSAWIRSPPPDQKSTVKSTTPTEPEYANEDVNRDGVIDNDDLTAIANNLGATPKGDIQHYDVDGDGDIDTADFQQVLNSVEANAAPAARSLTEPRLPQLVEPLLVPERTPKVTALLPNYPNPFNPETWIPYRLANDAEVILTIYAVDGQVVRELDLGHRTAGVYQHRAKAAYWDGRDALGFPVSSGVYFYTLSADDFSATRKMLIAK